MSLTVLAISGKFLRQGAADWMTFTLVHSYSEPTLNLYGVLWPRLAQSESDQLMFDDVRVERLVQCG